FYKYDEAGEPIFSIAPTGSVTQAWYNADGKVTATRQYAKAVILPNALTPNGSGGNLSTVQLEALVSQAAARARPSANDPVTYQVYNANGQLQYSIDPTGNVTETRYNTAGQIEETLAYAHA